MIDEKRIADFFAELVSIDSPSLEECEMADTLKAKFAEIGVNFTEDHTQEQTGSNAGNLFARIPGSIDGAPVLFAAHMDTVEPAKGKKAVFHDDGTVTSDGTTVLGADDLAGVTAIYEAVRHITEAGAPHSPIEILISTGEELYCKGANAFDYSQVQAKEAYVLDLSGAIGELPCRRRNPQPEPRDGDGTSGDISENLPAGGRRHRCQTCLGRKAEHSCV